MKDTMTAPELMAGNRKRQEGGFDHWMADSDVYMVSGEEKKMPVPSNWLFLESRKVYSSPAMHC